MPGSSTVNGTPQNIGNFVYGGKVTIDASGNVTTTGLAPQQLKEKAMAHCEALFALVRTHPAMAGELRNLADEARLLAEEVERKLGGPIDLEFDASAALQQIATRRKAAEALCRGEKYVAQDKSAKPDHSPSERREAPAERPSKGKDCVILDRNGKKAPSNQRHFKDDHPVAINSQARFHGPTPKGQQPAYTSGQQGAHGGWLLASSTTVIYSATHCKRTVNGRLVEESFRESRGHFSSLRATPGMPGAAQAPTGLDPDQGELKELAASNPYAKGDANHVMYAKRMARLQDDYTKANSAEQKTILVTARNMHRYGQTAARL